MMNRHVVITGMGIISPFGVGLQTFWNNISNGLSCIAPIESFDPSCFTTTIGGEIKNFCPGDYIQDRESLNCMSRPTQLGVACARMAVEDAGLDLESLNPDRIGVITGTGTGNVMMFDELNQIQIFGNPRNILPRTVLMGLPNSTTSHIAIQLSINGYSNFIESTCAASTHAVGLSSLIIQRGWTDVMIAGGAEVSLTPIILSGYCALGALSQHNDEPESASRPFDRSRDGFVLSDGAAMLILEEFEHARKRGADIYAEVLGYGASCDAYRLTDPPPDGSGAILAIKQALWEASLSPCQVQYINAHGTGTRMNDIVETHVLKSIFKDDAYRIPISSMKSMFGHSIGASGAIELVGVVLTMRNSFITPTINLDEADPECDLDYVANEGREQAVAISMKNSFGFGGQNAVLILKGTD